MIPYFIPDMPTTEQLIPYFKQIERNRWYSNFGPLYKQLKLRIATECLQSIDPGRISLVSSGTSAIELALKSLKIPVGSKVLTTCFTFPATIEAIINAGFIPVISDIDEHNWFLTPELAKRNLSIHNISAVVPVAAFGMPVCSESWAKFHKSTGLPVVVDAAAALLNQPINDNLIYAFSLHATKPLGAGEGGVVVSQNKASATAINKASNFGFEPNRSINQTGNNSKISEYHCAVGLAQLDRLESIKKQRQSILDKYRKLIEHESLPVTVQENIESDVPASLYVVFDQTNTGELFENLLANNIETRRLYWPLIQGFPAFKNNCIKSSINFTHAQHISSNGLALPFHNFLSNADIEHTVTKLSDLLFKQVVSS